MSTSKLLNASFREPDHAGVLQCVFFCLRLSGCLVFVVVGSDAQFNPSKSWFVLVCCLHVCLLFILSMLCRRARTGGGFLWGLDSGAQGERTECGFADGVVRLKKRWSAKAGACCIAAARSRVGIRFVLSTSEPRAHFRPCGVWFVSLPRRLRAGFDPANVVVSPATARWRCPTRNVAR